MILILVQKNPKCPTLAPSSEHVNSPIGYRPLVSHEKQLDSGLKKLRLLISLYFSHSREGTGAFLNRDRSYKA